MTKIGDVNSEQGFGIGFTKVGEALGRYEGTEKNARDLCELIRLPPAASVLDVACGGGRYSIALHRLGHQVTAFDLSPEQIEFSKKHKPGPNYLVADMLDPPGENYDLVLVAYSGFGLLPSEQKDRKALATWNTKLKVGGWLVMEVSDLERAEYRYGRNGKTVTFDDGVKHEAYSMDWRTNILTVTHAVDGIGSFTCRRRVYTRSQIVEMVVKAGFGDVEVFGSFSGAEKRPENRAIIIGRRL